MKKTAWLAISAIILFFGASSMGGLNTIPSETGDETINSEKDITVSVNIPFPSMTDNDIWTTFDNSAMQIMMKEGYPMLPYTTKAFTFPLGTTISDVQVTIPDIRTFYIEKPVEPAPAPALTSNENMDVTGYTTQPAAVYQQNEIYPDEWVSWNTYAGIDNGEHVLIVSIMAFPVRYSPALCEILYAENMEITITYEPPTVPMLTADAYDLLILCPDDWKQEIQLLKEHKEQYGLATIIVGVNEIYSSAYFPVQGRDNPERVKYFIKNAIEEWGIEYVMIFGGFDEFPMRKSWVYDANEVGWIDIPVPTDQYYADIYNANMTFSSWDTNNNSYFGEFARRDNSEDFYDTVDLHADVYVGRLACENIQEVQISVDKIIQYENNAYGTRWFNRVVCVAGDDAPNDRVGNVDEGILLTEASLEYLSGFRPIRLYPSPIIPELRLNTFTIIAAISLGCGFVHFSGHGNMVVWSTHPHNDSDTWIGNIGNDQISYLMNGQRLPVIRLTACLCAALDYTRNTCLAWKFMAKEDGGSVAIVGSTRLSYFYIGSYVDQGIEGLHGLLFFQGYEPGTTPAKMLVYAQNTYMNMIPMSYERDSMLDFKTIEEFILLGDPSLKIGGYP